MAHTKKKKLLYITYNIYRRGVYGGEKNGGTWHMELYICRIEKKGINYHSAKESKSWLEHSIQESTWKWNVIAKAPSSDSCYLHELNTLWYTYRT